MRQSVLVGDVVQLLHLKVGMLLRDGTVGDLGPNRDEMTLDLQPHVVGNRRERGDLSRRELDLLKRLRRLALLSLLGLLLEELLLLLELLQRVGAEVG